MKVLTSADETRREIERLTRKCERLRWAVAWASSGFPLFDALKKYEHKIHQLVIGIHFYQTHPDFIAAFIGNDAARFVMKPDGVFHPKLYLFERAGGRWDCIVGSHNFTKAAFTGNAEAAVLFSDGDAGADAAYAEIDAALDGYFTAESAKRLTEKDLAAYRAVWRRQQKRLAPLAGHYGGKKGGTLSGHRSPLESDLFVMDWHEYFEFVKDDVQHTTSGRLAVLEEARRLFETHEHLALMDDDSRRGVGGYLKNRTPDWLWFGNMEAHGFFKNAVNENPGPISEALDEIPLVGEVTSSHFDRYVSQFRSAFKNAGLSTATRLLAMKRPDYFICLSSKNQKRLCDRFAAPKEIGFENFWEAVVVQLQDCNWWDSPEPEDEFERRIWRCRAAFLDVPFYQP